MFEVTGVEARRDGPNRFTWPVRDVSPRSLVGTGEANIVFTVDGAAQQPFTHYGVRVTPGYSQYIRKGYPVIEIVAKSDSGHPPWRISLILDPHQIVEGKNELEVDHFTVWAQMIQGNPASPDAQTLAFGISRIAGAR